jgi:hypothetical protein
MAGPSARLRRLAAIVVPVLALPLLAACGDTLFRSNFDQTPIGQPPAATQGVGAAAVSAAPGNVVIATQPGLPGRWVSIRRPGTDPSVSAFQARLIDVPQVGRYTFAATLFMPAGAGISTVQFERAGQPAGDPQGFLHLDFLPTNQVRVDDNESLVFGQFARDKPFIVQVTLNNGNPATAHIVLSGDGASGVFDRTLPPPFAGLAAQFGAVRLWMGFPHVGEFKAANISVTRARN